MDYQSLNLEVSCRFDGLLLHYQRIEVFDGEQGSAKSPGGAFFGLLPSRGILKWLTCRNRTLVHEVASVLHESSSGRRIILIHYHIVIHSYMIFHKLHILPKKFSTRTRSDEMSIFLDTSSASSSPFTGFRFGWITRSEEGAPSTHLPSFHSATNASPRALEKLSNRRWNQCSGMTYQS